MPVGVGIIFAISYCAEHMRILIQLFYLVA